MPADGVSLPTTLAQLGNVARTQAKAQQAAPQVTPFSEREENDEETRVQRVKETSDTEKNRVTRQDDDKDKRKRRRLRRNARKNDRENEDPGHESAPEQEISSNGENDATEGETLGALIDLRV